MTSACSDSPSTASASAKPLKKSLYKSSDNRCLNLTTLLDNNRYDQFYSELRQANLTDIRRCFEEQAKQGKVFNFGVLINADIVNLSNENIFKPNIKTLDQFIDVRNESLCYMNSALYNIANSDFDDFLKIDKLFPAEWKKRDEQNLRIANPILQSLREVIYEISLGKKTNQEKIALMRKRHLESLKNLNELDIIANVYLELLLSYQFDQWEFYGAQNKEATELKHIKGDVVGRKATLSQIKQGIRNYVLFPDVLKGWGALGGLSCSLGKNQDIIYLDAIFSILDPWGKTARFLSLAITDKDVKNIDDKIYSYDGYVGKLILEGNEYNYHYFHSDLDFPNKHVAKRFRDPVSKIEKGRIYFFEPLYDDPTFYLVAKSRHNNSNHQIAEIYRYARNEWETHNFFGPPSFANKTSATKEGGYQDYTYFFLRKN